MDDQTLMLGLFGSLRATRAGREIHIASGPARRVLGYLALNPGGSEARGRLAATIWEKSDETHARQNLRQALHFLGQRFGQTLGQEWQGLVADRTTIALVPDKTVTDLQQVMDAVAACDVPEALLDGDLLPDRLLADEAGSGEMFESWLSLRRRDYENRLRDGLGRILEIGSRQSARRAAQALLVLDRSDEGAARFLIRDYHAAGQTGRALDIYESLWNHLGDEYDTEPGADTLTLIAQIKSEPAKVTPARVRPRERLSVGLAPVAASGDAHTTGTARLFRADLLATLLRFRNFELVDLEVARHEVDYVLEVSVGAHDGQLLLLAVLTRSADGVVIWSERWSGLTQGWLKTQAAVVGRLASACSMFISNARLQEISKAEVTASAVDDWLMGNKHLDRFTGDGLKAAAACFQRVINKAPDSSMGYSSLARLGNGAHLMQPGLIRDARTHAESKVLASKAVALDPMDSRAHLHRAWACCLLGEYDQSAASFALARLCNANDPWTILSSALGAAFSGETGLAHDLGRRAIEEGWTTAPFQWGFHMAIRFLEADYQGCVVAAENAQTAIINVPAWKAAALWHLGRTDEARDAWADFEHLSRADWSGKTTPKTTPDTKAILAWFLSCFPIRSPDSQRKLAAGAAGAADLQVHWVQQ